MQLRNLYFNMHMFVRDNVDVFKIIPPSEGSIISLFNYGMNIEWGWE